MDEKIIEKFANDVWMSICEKTSDKEERKRLAKEFVKRMERETSLSELLDSEDSEN